MTTEPQQLNLWPDYTLPGQLLLFNREADAGGTSEEMPSCCRHCESVVVRHYPGHLCLHCEILIAEYLAGRHMPSKYCSPAGEPIWEPRYWFGKSLATEIVPAACTYV